MCGLCRDYGGFDTAHAECFHDLVMSLCASNRVSKDATTSPDPWEDLKIRSPV